MQELKYSINNLDFKTIFGIRVKDSSGFGGLKRKQPEEFSFPEQNGMSLDLEEPYFESRKITLNCWIKADSWQQLYDNFNLFMAEFRKPKTQRLLIEYPPAKERIYQVVSLDETQLRKKIRGGKMFAEFDLDLIEPNPIKKVLVYTGSGSPTLKYNSPEETEIFLPNGGYLAPHSNVDVTLDLTALTPVKKFIVIAGNIRKITNFVAPQMQVLWQEL